MFLINLVEPGHNDFTLYDAWSILTDKVSFLVSTLLPAAVGEEDYFFFTFVVPVCFVLTHIISLLSVLHTIYSIMQTKIQGLHVSTIYGHLQALFFN